MKVYCKICHEKLEISDASHMLFNKEADIKMDFVSCRNPECVEKNMIVCLIKKKGSCPICLENDSEEICEECQKKHKTTHKKIMKKIGTMI